MTFLDVEVLIIPHFDTLFIKEISPFDWKRNENGNHISKVSKSNKFTHFPFVRLMSARNFLFKTHTI